MKRRVLYLHDVENRNADEITTLVVEAQKELSYEGDFYPQVKSDMEQMGLTDEDMTVSKETLRAKLDIRAKECAFTELINKAKSHSKIRDSIYTNMKGADHYNNPRFSPDLSNLLFKFRTRTYMVKNNFRNNYRNTNTLCPLCEEHEDDQNHLFQCEKIKSVYSKPINCEMDDIFSDDENLLYVTACTIKELVEIRDSLLLTDD